MVAITTGRDNASRSAVVEKLLASQAQRRARCADTGFLKPSTGLPMSSSEISLSCEPPIRQATGWRELWRKEDWWAVWLGLALVLSAYVLFASGSGLPKWIAGTPGKRVQLAQGYPDYPHD